MTLNDPFATFPKTLSRLPRLIRLYIFNCLLGFALSACFTGLILWFDVGNIAHLITHVSGGWLACFVFFMLNGIVFAGVQTGIVIMSLDDKTKSDHSDGRPGRLSVNRGFVPAYAAQRPNSKGDDRRRDRSR